MANVTAIIPTYNEEASIASCIESLKGFAEKIILMDFFSTDQTKEIAERLGAIVLQRNTSYKERINEGIALNEVTTKWVFNIDADERLTDASRRELTKLTELYENNDKINGIVIKYRFVFMGKVLNHGVHSYKMRMFKKNMACMENVELDEHFLLKTGRAVKMKTPVLHYEYKTMDIMINKLNHYSQRHAKAYFEQLDNKSTINYDGLASITKVRRFLKHNFYLKLPISLRSNLYFIFVYYLKFGFLDGTKGKMFLFIFSYWYRYLTDMYILEEYENRKNKDR